MNNSLSVANTSAEALISQVADEYLQRLERGEQPPIDEYAGRYPQIAATLRQVLPALQLLRHPGAADSTAGLQPEGPLGDYRIVREIGRGGMGVVYEAVQISLGRRVALKVLPFAAALDPKQLQRFKNEAQAAAQLHHTNIVPVFGVGCERGVHYYAMQYIEGSTLAAVIWELRQLAGLDVKDATRYAPPVTSDSTPPAAMLSTVGSTRDPAFFRTVANLGVQAAEALEHAHQLGIVHRDIKPANLLVDVRGNLWITDLGLARFHSDVGLTMSGDLLGTLRFMSPEQALAKHGLVDHRTDIYSLGATLYELLTLQPACPGEDRQHVLRQIEREDPQPPRSLNAAIPADLETIVLKALAKEPESRYATSQELAEDLRRFLEDKPIRAKRPTPWQRGRRWLRRHQGTVLTAGLSAVLVLAVSMVVVWHQLQRALEAETDRTSERDRAILAEQEKTDELCRAELALARADRLTSQAGQHFGGLDRIRRAIALRGRDKLTQAQALDLRNEAIACLAAVDARPLPLHGLGKECYFGGYAFDHSLEHCTYIERNGQPDRDWQLVLRRLADDKVVQTFPPPAPRPGVHFWHANARFSPDGRFLRSIYAVSRSTFNVCVVWEVETGRRVFEKDVRGGADFHPDSRTLAMQTRDGNITLYRLPEGEEIQRLELSELGPLLLSFDPTGRRLACLSNSKESLQIVDIQTGKPELIFPSQPAHAPPAWSPDGRWVATSYDDRAHVYDTVRRRLHSILQDREASMVDMAFSPSGGLLASTGYDATTRLWDPHSGELYVRLAGEFLRFSSDDLRLAFRKDGAFGIWKLAGGQVCRTLHHVKPGDQTTGLGVWGVDFSGDGKLLASAGADGVRLWDPVSAHEVNHLATGYVGSVQFDPRRDGFVTHGVAGLLYWPLQADAEDPARSWQVGPAQPLFGPGSANAPRAAWDRQGHWLAFTDAPRQGAVLLNIKASSDSLNPSPDANPSPDRKGGNSGTAAPPLVLPGQARPDRAQAIALSPDGRWAAATYWQDPGVCVWEMAGAKRPRYLPGPQQEHARVVAFSPDNQWLIVGGVKAYRWWRVGSWQAGPVLPMSQQLVPHAPVAFSRDGAFVAITRTSHTVQLIEAANPQREFATLDAPHGHLITALAFNPDSTLLAVATTDQAVQLWDLRLLRQQLDELDLDWDRPPAVVARSPDRATVRRPWHNDEGHPDPIQLTLLPGSVRTGAVASASHFEAEDLPVVAADGPYQASAMDRWWKPNWSNGRILFCQTPQNGYVEVEIECPSAGPHLLDIAFAKSADYGILEVTLDGQKVGNTFDGYHEYVAPSGPVSFGEVQLSEGRHRLRFTAIDKNPKSRGYYMGIDYLTLRLLR